MLLDLKILNGNMSLKFDKYVNTYTIEVKNDVESLEIEYKIRESDEIKIINNDNLETGLNYVFLEITNESEKNMYTLEVYKEKSESVFKSENINRVEQQKEMPQNAVYIISGVCVFVILIFFIAIFCRKKSK